MRRPKIKDVADRAGVSVSTVSVVLNEANGARVSADTRERVQRAARDLGYATNSIARSLRTQRSMTIGFVSDVIATTPFAGRMIQGAQDAAWQAGYLMLLVNTGGQADLEAHAIHALRQRQVDGVLYATMYHQVVPVPKELTSTRTVLLDARPAEGDTPYVVPDEEGGARAAVTELTLRGHCRIAFITDEADVPATIGRLAGYRAALADAGITVDPALVCRGRSDTSGGYRTTSLLLDLAEPPTAVFCYNDRMAMGAYRAAAERGLRIPRDLSVVGFDDQDLIAPELAPALTTVALPHFAMGEWAAQTLLRLITQDEVEQGRTMPCLLIRRDSVGPPPR